MIDKEINKMIGAKLRKLRLDKDYKEAAVAKILQVHPSTYSRIECGESSLTKDKAQLLADFYEINLNEIFASQDGVNIQDSFHNNQPSSGNYNSTIMPNQVVDTLMELEKTHTETNTKLMEALMQNQQLIMEQFRK
jgi:transcriptional regulator with XRE-family HTH domain